MVKVTEATKQQLLREYSILLDWGVAAKKLGINSNQLAKIREDKLFMRTADKIVKEALENSGAKEALTKFKETQDYLRQELQNGNATVAGALMRSHELEFKHYGLFEKDNTQKVAPMQINIQLQSPTPPITTIEGEPNGKRLRQRISDVSGEAGTEEA